MSWLFKKTMSHILLRIMWRY